MKRSILLYGMSDYAYEIRDLLALLPEIEMAGYVTSHYNDGRMLQETKIYTAGEACRSGYEIILASPVHFPSMAALLSGMGYDRFYEDLGAFLITLTLDQRLRLFKRFKETNFNLQQLYYLHDIICIEEFFARIQTNGRSDLFKKLQKELSHLEKSNGTRYYQRQKVRVGVLCDRYFYNEIEPSVECILIKELSTAFYQEIDILFVTNASLDEQQNDLKEVIRQYRNKGTKTIYYSFNDSLLSAYSDIARLCEFIFTTNARMVDKIKEVCPDSFVSFQDHFINPLEFNPIGCMGDKRRDSLFYRGKFTLPKEQEKVLENILDAGIEAGTGLTILAEQYNGDVCDIPIPRKYMNVIAPDEAEYYNDKFFKLFRYVAHIEDIPIKGALRTNTLLHLQAQGCIVFSNYSREILNQFPNINIAHTKQDVIQHLNVFTKDETDEQAMYSVRCMMNDYTCFKRMEQILNTVGIDFVSSSGKVAVIGRDNGKAYEMFNRQIYKEKYFIKEDKIDDFDINQFDYIAFFDETCVYEEFYLQDMINAFKYVDVDYVTKNESVQHGYVEGYTSKYKTVFWCGSHKSISEIKNSDTGLGYSVDRLEFSEEQKVKGFLERDYKISVAIPIHNSGRFLFNKTFNSLRRSTFFDYLEIILADDGSTDGLTPTIVRRLGRKYDNVRVISLKEKSGSPSVPRNEGLYAAGAKYIMFIDSDDEVACDSFETLYKEIIKGYEAVCGSFKEVSESRQPIMYPGIGYATFMQLNGVNIICDGRQWLLDSAFERMLPVWTTLFSKSFLMDNEIKFLPKAVAEDYMFFVIAMLKIKKGMVISNIVYFHYADTMGSFSKGVNSHYFKGTLTMQKELFTQLKKENIFETYIQICFQKALFRRFYFYNLARVKKEDWHESLEAIYQMLKLCIEQIQDEQVKLIYNLLQNKDDEGIRRELEKAPILREN